MARAAHRAGVVSTVVAAAIWSLGGCGGSDGPASRTPTPAPTITATATATATTTTGEALPSGKPAPAPATSTARTPSATTRAPTATTRPSPTTARPPTTPTRPTACAIPSRLMGQDVTTLGTSRKLVALTFDGGAGNEAAASVLRTLGREGVPASFFLTGEFVDDFPSTARTIAAGYPIGNHSYHHPDFTTLSSTAIRSELTTAAARLRAVTGQDPHPWFRFPSGAADSRTIAVVNSECYVSFRWTVDTLGWKGTSGGQSAASVVSRVLAAAQPGEIVLMHLGANPTDHSTLDADALPQVIAGLRARGYSFVTLSAVISAAP